MSRELAFEIPTSNPDDVVGSLLFEDQDGDGAVTEADGTGAPVTLDAAAGQLVVAQELIVPAGTVP